MNFGHQREIEELYRAASRLGPKERSALLGQVHAELRSEVEALLARDDPGSTQTAVGAGTQLGPYKIEARLGAGGMGEVFRARDTRLGRTVAIKILPHDKVADPQCKRRFMQEARAASALNHPNIVTLHDIASDSGVDYLVMEYVPGKSLDKLVTFRGLPVEEATGYATQIAGALAAAHAAGIVHRDIKPANVIVTAESQVKVLDFGLAKLMERAPLDQGETLTQESTQTQGGMVMGTIAYMSPEQATARPLDHRTDIFSLGVVLYEMLAGRRPFRGESPVETMSAIIHDPAPALSHHPPEVDEILAKALAKDPKDRYQHAGDLRLDLWRFQRAWQTKSLPSMRGVVATQPRRWTGWAIGAAVVTLGLISAGWWVDHRGTAAFVVNPLANAQFTRFTDFPGSENDAAISPDGKWVAFVSDREGPFDVWLSQVGTSRFFNLTQGKEDSLRLAVRDVGFSADGSEIWLSGAKPDRRLRLIPLMGGTPRPFLSNGAVNVAWSPDGSRLVYHTYEDGDPMFVADRTGANARRIFAEGPGLHHHYPVWSPDGQWIYFASGIQAIWEYDVWRIAASGGKPERLTHHRSDVRYPTPISGRTVLYVSPAEDGSGPWLWALDVERKITQRVSFGLEKYTSVAATADGRRLVATVANPSASLWSVPILDHPSEEHDVKAFPLPTPRALAPRFGGTSLFYLSSRGTGDGLWRYQDGQSLEILKGSDGALRVPPAVSPDGRQVAVVLRRDGKLRLHIVSADGAELRPLAEAIDVRGTSCWSPDGKWIVTGGEDVKGAALFKIPLDGGPPVRLIAGLAINPVWSPDRSLIVYDGPNVSLVSPLMAVRPDGTPVDLPGIKLRIEGERCRFLPNGGGLVYMQGLLPSQDFWLLDLATMKARPLTHLSSLATMRTFDITPDGKQIVFDRLRENSDIVLIDLPK